MPKVKKALDRKRLYIGRSGELAVLSEFLSRGYNAATPEIDIGEDVFVIEDGKQGYWPVQVKTATAKELKNGKCSAQFKFRKDQLVTPTAVELTYILALRRKGKWTSFLIIPREKLNENYTLGKLGKQNQDELKWTFIYTDKTISCQQADFTSCEFDWDDQWPDLLK